MNKITIIRRIGDFGIDAKLNGYELDSAKPIKRHYYNGRLCWRHNNKLIGFNTIKQEINKCNLILSNRIPF